MTQKQELHPFIKAAGMKDEKSFYSKFPDKESYFEHMNKKMQMGGVIPNMMPSLYPTGQPVRMKDNGNYDPQRVKDSSFADTQLRNGNPNYVKDAYDHYNPFIHENPGTSAAMEASDRLNAYQAAQDTYNQHKGVTKKQTGGYHQQRGYHYNGEKMVKSAGSGTWNPGLSTYFEYGGLRAGNQFPDYIDATVDLNQYLYGGLRAGNEYPNYVDDAVNLNQRAKAVDDDIPEFAKGGIHIKKSHIGKFTEYKKRTGKTTEQAMHSKDPHVKAMAVFAHNAKSWYHKQMGGNTGNEYSNPFNPIHEYQIGGGGPNFAQHDDISTVDPPIIGKSGQEAPTGLQEDIKEKIPMPGTSQQDSKWNEGMTSDEAIANINAGGNSDQRGIDKAAWWGRQGAEIGALALATGQAFNQRTLNKNAANQQHINGQTLNQFPQVENQFGKGWNAPTTYSQSPSMSYMKNGGTKYQKGGTYEIDENELNMLTRKGYKFAKV